MNKIKNTYENKEMINIQTEGHFWQGMKKLLFGNETRFPQRQFPIKKVSSKEFSSRDKNLKITWLGHSSCILEIDNLLIMFDPVFSKRISPISFLGPKRFQKEFALQDFNFKKIDAIIISHNHYDHLDKRTLKKLNHITKKFIVPSGVGKYLKTWNIGKGKIKELDWWESILVEKKLKLVSTPAQHFSGRYFIDNNTSLWSSWTIIGQKERVFFSGDTGYFDGFKTIGEKYGPFDLTIMENGQYNEGWEKIHMFPEETIQAHLDLQGQVLLPIHWGSFNLSLHNWYDPIESLLKAGEKKNVKIITPIIGVRTNLTKNLPQKKWWREIIEKEIRTTKINLALNTKKDIL